MGIKAKYSAQYHELSQGNEISFTSYGDAQRFASAFSHYRKDNPRRFENVARIVLRETAEGVYVTPIAKPAQHAAQPQVKMGRPIGRKDSKPRLVAKRPTPARPATVPVLVSKTDWNAIAVASLGTAALTLGGIYLFFA